MLEDADQTPEDRPPARGVRVRMYRHGFGDCFLLSVPNGGRELTVLVDCGVILGTPNAEALMTAVAADVVAATGGHLDVAVVTHEHWDHVSGFVQARAEFEKLTIGEAWLPWTLDPDNDVAERIRRGREARVDALWKAVGGKARALRSAGLTATAEQAEAHDGLARAAEVLSFFGIDATIPPAWQLDGPRPPAAGTSADALDWLRGHARFVQYLGPGSRFETPEPGGPLSVYVLGPQPEALDGKSDGGSPGQAIAHVAAAALAGLPPTGLGVDEAAELQRQNAPFDAKYRVPFEIARQVEFFRDHYFGGSGLDGNGPDDWRRIDGAWTSGASAFALALDGETNESSLALAFELDDGRVLLFPGDTQSAGWSSWHTEPNGQPRYWARRDGRRVAAPALLRNTVVYKVSHHGSHAATHRTLGLDLMTHDDLVAFLPVDEFIARERKRWTKLPFRPLLAALETRAHGRILRPDADVPKPRAGNRVRPFPGEVKLSATMIDVETTAGPAPRPLWVEYTLPPVKSPARR